MFLNNAERLALLFSKRAMSDVGDEACLLLIAAWQKVLRDFDGAIRRMRMQVGLPKGATLLQEQDRLGIWGVRQKIVQKPVERIVVGFELEKIGVRDEGPSETGGRVLFEA